jgi:hypothetical protein
MSTMPLSVRCSSTYGWPLSSGPSQPALSAALAESDTPFRRFLFSTEMVRVVVMLYVLPLAPAAFANAAEIGFVSSTPPSREGPSPA